MEALFSANIIDPHHDKKGHYEELFRSNSKELLDPSLNSNKRETPKTNHDTIAEKRPNANRAIVEWTIDADICEENGRWHNGHVRIPVQWRESGAGLTSINRITGEASVIEKSPNDDGMCTSQMLAHVRCMNRAGKLEQSSTLS